MVRTSPGSFIKEFNRINVGITRAKHGLVIIGSASNLSKDPKWKKLLETHKANVVKGTKGAKKWIQEQKIAYLTAIRDT